MIKKIIVNPNFVYILSFIVPFVVYTLGWSTIYPTLSIQLFLFYLFTFIVCGICGVFIHKIKPFKYYAIPQANGNVASIVVIYFLYTLEVIYSRSLPIVVVLFNSFDYSDEFAFGIPVLHTFLVSFNTFYGTYLFHQYISTKNKKLFWLFIISILPFVLFVSRSSILNIVLGAFIVFLLSKVHFSAKIILKSILGILLVFYLFGYLGNLRSGNGDATYIPRASGATDKFLNSSIPKELYWGYLYIASPVANLQNNIDYTLVPEGSYSDLFLNEFLPAFFTKFILPPTIKQFHQINPFLNVGTIYVFSFSYQRWKGMILMFIYFITIINLYYLFVIKSNTYKVTGLAILYNVIIFANFHNTIAYSAASIQLIYPILFSMAKDYINKKNSTNNI